jgi:Glycosyl hydrolase family 79 C-terminal beta domain
VAELTVNNAQISGYAFFEGTSLSRALFINLNAYENGQRGSVHLNLNFQGAGKQPTSAIVKRLYIP